MKVAVLGAGNGGCAVAADLSLRAHDVTLIKTSKSLHNDNFQHLLDNNGTMRLLENGETHIATIKQVTTDLSELAQADIVTIYVQSNYHEDLLRRIVPFIRDGQIVVFCPGYLSTAYFLKHCDKLKPCDNPKHFYDRAITIVEAESSFIDCRITEPGVVKIGFRNVRNPLGVYPAGQVVSARKKLDQLGFPFIYLSSVIEAALHNPNLLVHSVGAIMSIPRIEKTKGDYTMYHEVFTPSVWNILEKLDDEKMNVLESFGFKRLTYLEACKLRNTLDENRDARAIFTEYAAMSTRAKGPERVDLRYITEDVPQGLVLLESLAQQKSIETPVCTALIEIANAALKRDFRRDGRTMQRLGEKNIDKIWRDSLGNLSIVI